MMSNGNMKESIEKQAILDDVEPEAFARLVKFAYLGVCGMMNAVNSTKCLTSSAALPRPSSRVSSNYRCIKCGNNVSLHPGTAAELFPFCVRHYQMYNLHQISRTGQMCCTVYNCTQSGCSDRQSFMNPILDWRCSSHGGINDSSPKVMRNHRENIFGEKTSKEGFAARKYPCQLLSHVSLSMYIDSHQSTHPFTEPPPLIELAQLYCLADRYLVPELPEICLHILHRELVEFIITDESTEILIALLHYTYEHTGDDGDILDDTCDALRILVMSYIKEHSTSLMEYENFRDALSAGGGQTADFLALIFAKRIVL